MSLRALAVGAGATLQDAGRPGYRRFGVPIGGAFDRESLALGNALVGNPPSAAALELTVTGGRFQADGRHLVAFVGADLDLTLNGDVVPARFPLEMSAADVLALGPMRRGARGYLCVAGGLQAEPILHSVSGISIRPGDLLRAPAFEGPAAVRIADAPISLRPRDIRIVPGPQREAFPGGDLADTAYEVSSHAGRAGIRLRGRQMSVPNEAPSEPMCVGAVQITGDGLPVVIGPDGPTIGGYPKIACVVEADQNRLAQMLPGDELQFRWVSIEAARTLRESEADRIAAACSAVVGPRGSGDG